MGGVRELPGHEGGDHGPGDNGFWAGWSAFVVADVAAVPADLGEGALDDPAARQHLEGAPVALRHTLWA